MGAVVGDRVYDNGLTVLDTEANAVHICSQEPATYTEAVTTYSLGSKATPTIGIPQDRTGGGREVVMSAITDGSVSADGDADHYAIVDTVNSRLLIADGLSREFNVTNWDITGSTGTLTFEDTGDVSAMMTEVNGRDPNFGYIVLTAAIGNIPAGRYAITAVNTTTRTLSFAVAAAAGSGVVTAAGSVLPYPQAVTNGNTWSTPQVSIGFPDPE